MIIKELKSLWKDDRRRRRPLLIVNGGLVAFWIYSAEYVIHHPAAKGSDGFEVFMVIPVTFIAVFLTLPAVFLLISRRTIKLSAPVTLMAIVMNVLCGGDILWNSGLTRDPLWPLW
jgi:hypothetical protein